MKTRSNVTPRLRERAARAAPLPVFSEVCDNNRQRTCAWDRRQGRPVVIENISGTRCQENRNWGWDGNSTIWVNGGCRARFGAR